MKTKTILVLVFLTALCACSLAQETAEDWYEKGQDLYQNQSPKEAVQAYDKAIALNQSFAEAWRAKGQAQILLALESAGDIMTRTFDEAARSYEKAIEIQPGNATLWNEKGNALSVATFYSSNASDLHNLSLQAYDKALELEPKNAEAWRGKGIVYSEQKKYDLALDAFNKSLDADPKYRWSLVSKGSTLMQMGRLKEAVEYYDAALKIQPEDPGTQMMKAEALAKLGLQNESDQTYIDAMQRADKAILAADTKENLSRAWHEKATLFINQGKYAEAIAAYDNVTAANPRERSAWFMMAFAADQTARYDKALEAYEGALVLNENDSTALFGKGDSLYKLGRYNESKDAFDSALKADPKMYSAYKGKGDALKALNRSAEAAEAYETALGQIEENIKSNPENARSWQAKGDVLLAMNRTNEALSAFDKAIELGPEHFAGLEQKGDALMDLGRYEDAFTAYDKATVVDPAFPRPWYKKGQALKALNRQSEADSAFAEAKEMGYKAQNESVAEMSVPPKILAITSIKAIGEDEFLVVANSRIAAQSLKGWTLDVSEGWNSSSNQSVTLPDFIIDPDERVNIHLGRGESNETDVFLNSAITLNDTAGNVTLKDDTGMIVASFGYRVEPDGSIAGVMTAEGEFSYPSDQNEVKMVVREAGSGPYVTERTEYEPEAANYSWIRNTSLERSGKEML